MIKYSDRYLKDRAMNNTTENKQESYIVVRNTPEGIMVWQAPRGLNAEKPEERWSFNLFDANKYDFKSYAVGAIERNAELYPEEFKDAEIISFQLGVENYHRSHFNSLTDYVKVYPKAKKVYVLETAIPFYFASPQEREIFVKDNGLNGRTYDLKFI